MVPVRWKLVAHLTMKWERGYGWLRKSGPAFFFCLAATATTFGQSSSESSPPAIEILKLKWEKEVRLPRNFDPPVIPTNGSFADPASRTSAAAPTSAIDATRAATSARDAAASSNTVFPATPRRLPITYVYSMKVKNAGTKTIEGVAWDYLFIDPNTNVELGRRQFLSYEKVATDRIAFLQSRLRSPPIRVIQASNSPRKQQPKLVERAVIQCVLYSDDTLWRNSSAREGLCDLLKSGKSLIKRKPVVSQSH